MKTINETVISADGTPVITARFVPADCIGVVLTVHGFGEHHANYFSLGEFFCAEGFAAVAFDQRGFGANHKNSRGVLDGYELFLDDIALIRKKIGEWFPNKPVCLYGHSMGGNIVVNFILKRGAGGFEKLILETPWLRLYKPMPGIVDIAARLIGRFSPKAAISGQLVLDDISHDRKGLDAIRNDELRHKTLSFRIYTQIREAGEYAITNAKKISVPTLLLCAEADRIVSPDAIKEFARNANENVTLYTEKEGYHALHIDSEPIRGRALGKMVEFLKNN